ncbi:MAG: PPC domain-containing protein [Planctomycetes bacterium]|nr:PPC domain-containing protein [Planctomycetota bacterium]MBL7038494.1 PPC domain-containing protein [Pirellulaceae bacterium]
MSRSTWLPILGLAGLLAMVSSAHAQRRGGAYIGYVYPAGGQQGTTFHVKLGGQGLDQVDKVVVTGEGVSTRVVDFYRNMGNQELRYLRDQLRQLQRGKPTPRLAPTMVARMMSMDPTPVIGPPTPPAKPAPKPRAKPASKTKPKPKTEKDKAKQKLIEKIQTRMAADNRRPANRSASELVFVEVTIAPDAKPGPREIRVVTTRGMTNPMAFYVGQVPEVARRPMKTASFQVLGKEHLAQRTRPPEEEEMQVTVPCTMNGQIASGEVNRYRFEARKGQRLVISVKARELVPYIADGVPGWFQPVLALCDAEGKELAYNDDFRFKPDPTLNFEVPADGEYVLSIIDALYRGRNDFVYRITVAETPFVTSIFPLGARVGDPVKIEMDGWNLDKATLAPPPKDAGPGTHMIAATKGKVVSNHVPFALDTLPECLDEESNDQQSNAQKVELPIIVNGRMDRPNDWDVFEVEGKADETIVAEVHARRLDSPVDSFVKVTDASGKMLAFNDDHHDAGSGLNTHHADSYLMVKLPADGKYFVHMGDTTRQGGKEYAYRLRISPPRPDFELRVVPPSIALRGRNPANVTVYAVRKDGFAGAIKLSFKDLPEGFTANSANLAAGRDSGRLTVKSTLREMDKPVSLTVVGTAKNEEAEIVHEAVPAEDRMQAFLWRHLMPAQELMAVLWNAAYRMPETRVRPPIPEAMKPKPKPGAKPKYNERQVANLLRQIERLYQEWYLTDDFANREIAKVKPEL